MSFVTAKIYDAVVAPAEWLCLADWRRALVAPLGGSILEIGAGTGRNLANYGLTAERIVLAEPDRHMRQQLSNRLADSRTGRSIELSDATAERLEFVNASFDNVVSTLVLCSVADPARSIEEAYRVLRPGGRFLLIEHILAPEGSSRRRWQERLAPVWSRLADGCRLDRDPRQALRDAGFEQESLIIDELRGAPGFLRTILRGAWRKPMDPLAPRSP